MRRCLSRLIRSFMPSPSKRARALSKTREFSITAVKGKALKKVVVRRRGSFGGFAGSAVTSGPRKSRLSVQGKRTQLIPKKLISYHGCEAIRTRACAREPQPMVSRGKPPAPEKARFR